MYLKTGGLLFSTCQPGLEALKLWSSVGVCHHSWFTISVFLPSSRIAQRSESSASRPPSRRMQVSVAVKPDVSSQGRGGSFSPLIFFFFAAAAPSEPTLCEVTKGIKRGCTAAASTFSFYKYRLYVGCLQFRPLSLLKHII